MPAANFARRGVPGGNAHGNLQQIVTAPPVPGNVTEQNGERKHGHHARTDSGGTPPRPVSAACPPNLFTIHYSLKTPGIDAASKGSLAKGSWYHRHLRDSQLAIPERMGLCGNLQACGIPPVLPEAKPPPFGKGGFGRRIHRYCSNDTGRGREVTMTDQPGAH